ncbi:MAG: hypothetical protein ABR909_03115 [Candidatus Bathyarchaeia archaeon]|jgi:hypothetical protein
MMRTVEVLIVIIIITGAFVASSFFAVLPLPRQVSPLNLSRLSLTTLEMLDSNHGLSQAAFDTDNSTLMDGLQVALSASLPPNVLYNLTIYNVNSGQDGATLYTVQKSISNAQSLGVTSDASSYLVANSSATFDPTPEKIGENSGGAITLYILNCSDANGWWITGYTPQSLAQDLYNLLSPYFNQTVMVQNTAQLGKILNDKSLHGENVRNAVVINTCGEAVPIPSAYCAPPYSNNGYAYYGYALGQKVNQYNWTWVSIVGYPFYYVSNTGYFTGSSDQNGWGIFGMAPAVGAAGLNSFLEGLSGQKYVTDSGSITIPDQTLVSISSDAQYWSNYYGIYPSPTQSAARAVSSTIESSYHLTAVSSVFNPVVENKETYLAGSTFAYYNSTGAINGKLIPIGLTCSTDIRITALALLSYYQPSLYALDFTAQDTSRLVVLQLGLIGGT